MKKRLFRVAAAVCVAVLCLGMWSSVSAGAVTGDGCDHLWVDGHVDIATGCIRYTCLLCGGEHLEAFAAPGMTDYDVSGDRSQPLSTRESIVQKQGTVTSPSGIFAQEPSVKAPHTAGKLDASFLTSGITYLNYLRYMARLPEVMLSADLNEQAQHGAVLLAAIGKLSHRPAKPGDMAEGFYTKGYAGTSFSNIAMSSNVSLMGSLNGFMQDTSSKTNLATMGHRRQLLNPTLDTVGFGCAQSASGGYYSTTWIKDDDAPPVDYQFISWPASGYFPTEQLPYATPWSVTLNPALYKTPSVEDIKVTITGVSDGKQVTMDKSTGGVVNGYTPYLTVNTEAYQGSSNCIIFLPDPSQFGAWRGVYTVEITGLRTRSGEATSIKYWVDFFGLRDCQQHTYTRIVNQPTCDRQGYTWFVCSDCFFGVNAHYVPATGHSFDLWRIDTEPDGNLSGKMHRDCANGHTEYATYTFPLTDVPAGKYFSKPVYWAYVNGITKGKTATEFQRDADCTRKQIVMFLWRAAGQPEPASMENPFTDVKADQFQKAILWAYYAGITSGKTATEFQPEAPCTREQIVMFLWRYFDRPEPDSMVNPFTDVKVGGTFEKAILWAYYEGITTGKTPTTFEPQATCTRGQIVTFLYRAMVE